MTLEQLFQTISQCCDKNLRIEADLPTPERAVTLTAGGATIYLPLASLVDLDAEKARLEKELANVKKQLAGINGKLNNEGFISKAPENVVEREKARKVDFATQFGQATRAAGGFGVGFKRQLTAKHN